MCLLGQVIEWTPRSIRCTASSHRDPANPLRGTLGLSAMAGIEYGAQAMALHGALGAGRGHDPDDDAGAAAAPHGVLAAVRGVVLHVARLDRCHEDLLVQATLVAGDAHGAMYEFTLEAGGRRLVEGRATVVLDPAPRRAPAGQS